LSVPDHGARRSCGGRLAQQLVGDGQVGVEQRVGVAAEAGDTVSGPSATSIRA
jgi:hypothetical protein